jgi:hypothetical protein
MKKIQNEPLTEEELQELVEKEKAYIKWFFDGMELVHQLCHTDCSSEAIFWLYTGFTFHWHMHYLKYNFPCPFELPWMMKDIPWSWNKKEE